MYFGVSDKLLFFLSFLLWHRDVNQVESRRTARVTQVQHNFRLSAKINAPHSRAHTYTPAHTLAFSVNCPSDVAAAATCRTCHINPQRKFICKCEKKRAFPLHSRKMNNELFNAICQQQQKSPPEVVTEPTRSGVNAQLIT